MKICVPVMDNNGIRSRVCRDLEDAPFIAIYDMSTNALAVLRNDHGAHHHCACNPVKFLAGKNVSVLIAGALADGAIIKLNASGIATYRARPGTLRELVNDFSESLLEVMTPVRACGGHD